MTDEATKRTSPYKMGIEHGRKGLARYCHRVRNTPYDSASARRAYGWGYADGLRETADAKIAAAQSSRLQKNNP